MNDQNECKAAFSQTDITPDFPVEMIGCYRKDDTPDGVLHPLYAQILLFERRTVRCCLIAIDSLGFTTALSDELRSKAAAALKTDASNIMLNFSHTHSAPAPLSNLNGQRYFMLVCERIGACLKDAISKLTPCRAAWTIGKAGIAENRRDGCSAVDDRLGALQVTDGESKAPIMTLLRVCAHANTLMTKSGKLSSDYIGLAREKISARMGCPVMIVQGAAGNLKPAGVDAIYGGEPSDTERIAEALARSAARLAFDAGEITRLAMREKEIELYSDVPTEEQAARIAGDSGMDATNWLNECARLRKDGIAEQTVREPLQFLFLNEGCLCGVPDEIFCEPALDAAARAKTPYLFLNGYTNGCTGYLPHKEEWVKGGYETFFSYLDYYPFHGHVLPFRKDTADRLVGTVLNVWDAENRTDAR